MILNARFQPFSALAVDLPSTRKPNGATTAGSSSSRSTVPRACVSTQLRKGKPTALVQTMGNPRSRTCPNRHYHQFHISVYSNASQLTGFQVSKNLRHSTGRTRELGIKYDGSRDHHEPSPDEEEYYVSSNQSKKDSSFKAPIECTKCPEGEQHDCSTSNVDQNCTVEPRDYTIRVSKELMGVFRYVEKLKRARTKDLADTLRKVSQGCFLLSCVRGILAPLVRVYKTSPPNWKNLLYMVGTFDAFAVSYLAMRAAEPLYQLSALTTEMDCDMIKSINREEEHMLALAIELVKLFRRMRNVALFIALTQLVQVIIQIRDPAFCRNVGNILGSWCECPWRK